MCPPPEPLPAWRPRALSRETPSSCTEFEFGPAIPDTPAGNIVQKNNRDSLLPAVHWEGFPSPSLMPGRRRTTWVSLNSISRCRRLPPAIRSPSHSLWEERRGRRTSSSRSEVNRLRMSGVLRFRDAPFFPPRRGVWPKAQRPAPRDRRRARETTSPYRRAPIGMPSQAACF